jgi:hypothetical protein
MKVLEIPVIGSRKSEKEKLFTLLANKPLRKFEGLDIGFMELREAHFIYFYFLNQESEDYYYLWDLILPFAPGCIVVCDFGNTEIFSRNVEIIELLRKRYDTPLHICSLPVAGEEPAALNSGILKENGQKEFHYFNPRDKNSAKDILQSLLSSV